MAIVNPNQGRVASLLNQIVAERDRRRAVSPSAEPSAPIRQIVQQPQLQAESPGSARVAAVKPVLEVAPPVQALPPQVDAQMPSAPVVGPVAPPIPEVPSVSTPQTNGGGGGQPSAPGAPAAPSSPAAPAAPSAPVQQQQSRGKVLGASTSLQPTIYPKGFVGPMPVGSTRVGGGRLIVQNNLKPKFA